MAALGAIARNSGPSLHIAPVKFYGFPVAIGGDNQGVISGAVTETGVGAVVGAVVRLYYRPTGGLIRETMSGASGAYAFKYLDSSDAANYYVMTLDPAGGTQYNLAVLDRMTPKVPAFTQTVQPQLLLAGAVSNPALNTPDFTKCVLLLRGDGTEGSTTITDSSGTPKTMTVNGNAKLTQVQAKFGGTSMVFDGAGDWVQTTSSLADFRFGTGNFTVEAWINITAGNVAVLDFYGSTATNSWQLFVDTTGFLIWYTSNGSTAAVVASATTGDVRTGWHHIAACRSGTTLKLFADGVQVASVTDSRDYNNTAVTQLAVGAQVFTRNSSFDLNGYVDEVRIFKGVAVYTAAFTPSTLQFPNF